MIIWTQTLVYFKVVKTKRRKRRKRRRGGHCRKKKTEGKSHGNEEEEKRQEKKGTQYNDILDKLEGIGDPYEDMDMLTKKTHALHQFYSYMKVKI